MRMTEPNVGLAALVGEDSTRNDADARSTALLNNVKGVFDPNGVMNPDRLCFR